jgi:hypothetical protein
MNRYLIELPIHLCKIIHSYNLPVNDIHCFEFQILGLTIDYIYLSAEEREQFANTAHDHLIMQHQTPKKNKKKVYKMQRKQMKYKKRSVKQHNNNLQNHR